MNKQLHVVSSLLLFFLLIGNSWAQGVLKGRVIDTQNLSLPGANVLLEGTNYGTITDQKGDFYFSKLPAGSYEVTVSYLGYGQLTKKMEIRDGQTSTLNFKMSESELEAAEFIVFGDRLKGQAKALNQQKKQCEYHQYCFFGSNRTLP